MEESVSELWTAVLQGEYDVAIEMIYSGANVNEPRNTDVNPVITLLHYTTSKENIKFMQVLINHGADYNAQNSKDQTPLY